MRLSLTYAAMNAGKSTHLLVTNHAYLERGLKTQLFTAAVDTRAGVGVIGSRLGISAQAATFDETTVFSASILDKDVSVLMVDECQFLQPAHAEQLHLLAHETGVQVKCYGLRSDFRGKAFSGMAALMILADDLQELSSICPCSKTATMNARFDDKGERVRDGEQIAIGGNSHYMALCPDCFYGTNNQPRKIFTPITQ